MKNKSGRLLVLITIILMCVSLVGCSNGKTVETQNTPSSSIATETAAEGADTVQSNQSTAKNEEKATAAKNQISSTKSSEQRTSAKNNPAGSTTQKAAEQTKNKAISTTKKASTSTTAASKKNSTTATTTSEITCTVEIECKKILNNMDKLKAGHENFIPSDGIIMNTCTVTVDNGDTVYDALKTACSQNGVSINAQSSVYGTYIAGFNNIDEMDCGRQSGWVYTVNDSSPPKSCDKYTVSSGDKIVFSFTC